MSQSPGRLSPEAAYAICARGYAITNEALDDVPRSLEDCKQPALLKGLQGYVKKQGAPAVQISFGDYYDSLKPISLSPSGKFAIFNVFIRAVPPGWREYEDPFIRAEARASRNKGPFSWLSQYMIVDTATGQVRPVIDGPVDLTLEHPSGRPMENRSWSPGHFFLSIMPTPRNYLRGEHTHSSSKSTSRAASLWRFQISS